MIAEQPPRERLSGATRVSRVGDSTTSEAEVPDGDGARDAMLASDPVVLGRPLLRELVDAESETAMLAVWDGAAAIALLIEAPEGRVVSDAVELGGPLPIDSAGTVACLANLHDADALQAALEGVADDPRMRVLSVIEDARETGYAISSTAVPGVSAIAAPVLQGSGEIAATIMIIAASDALEGARLDEIASALTATADDLSLRLGFVAG